MITRKLAELRKAKGWTQQDLADKTKIPRSMISRYEIDTMPGKGNMSRILKAFGLPEDYFYEIAVENKRMDIQMFDPIASKMINDLLELPKDEQQIVFSMIQSIKEKYASKKRTKKKSK